MVSSVRSPSKLTEQKGKAKSKSPSGKNLYAMDLGTMGIPREVAHMKALNNPLFASDNKVGPGDYDPN